MNTELGIYTRTALIAVLVNNDLHYMHWLSNGEDFDKSHNLSEEYYVKLGDEVDYLMELTLENKQPIYNCTLAGQLIPEYQPESKPEYDYPTIIECLKSRISIYISALRELRNSVENESIQSKLDDMVRDWEKELRYKLERRTERHMLNGFVNTGLDDAVVHLVTREV